MRAGTAAGEGAGRISATVSSGISAGGQHALAAELLGFIFIVVIRSVAAYGPARPGSPVAQAGGGKKTLPDLPADQYGPLFILGNGFAVFFVLAFLAARGGTAAKVAVAFGAAVDLALLLKSIPHIDLLAAAYEQPRRYKPESISGTYALTEAPVLSPSLQYEVTTGKLPPTPTGKGVQAAMSYARKLLPHYGWGPGQWAPLVKLWTRESSWDYLATNPSSGAYGIPQSLPPDKMATAGADWQTNPFTQIRWGLSDIKTMYGSPAAAWDHELHFGWY